MQNKSKQNNDISTPIKQKKMKGENISAMLHKPILVMCKRAWFLTVRA